ncbi:hypothetical protein B0H63DRAFT_520352 [Podospora didyma]|uniref:Uncharacterized protein n=1 Tax=Podospora didyma TaxID=330526 RepID=A0AAE0P0T3_9PEZI|nr:hypothetical protein B0H63DRAFT_520352 [Podospora didyma]
MRKKNFTVLITGCGGGGIVWALAKAFRERGYHVFATLRDVSKAEGLDKLSDIDVLELDVTDSDSIARCRDAVAMRTGNKLDVLVNNAGAEFICPLLDTHIAEAKRIYKVNVWGLLAVSYCPGTTNGLTGAYASSKAAAARMSEVMRMEMEPLGVRVVLVMVGSVATTMFTRPGGHMKLAETSYYHGVEEYAYEKRISHLDASMTLGPIWYGTYALLVPFATWGMPQWWVGWSLNNGRDLIW